MPGSHQASRLRSTYPRKTVLVFLGFVVLVVGLAIGSVLVAALGTVVAVVGAVLVLLPVVGRRRLT